MTLTPTLKVIEGQAYTTSLDVARHFQKNHKNVLQAIENALDGLKSQPADSQIEQFARVNFNETSYTDSKGEQRPMYKLTRDGFAFIAMGFTGPQADIWKIRYINAFNQMEAELTRRNLKEGKQAEQLNLFPHTAAALKDQRQVMTVSTAISMLAIENLNIPPLTAAQIKGLIQRGKLEGYRTDNRWVIVRESFDNWLEQRKRRAA